MGRELERAKKGQDQQGSMKKGTTSRISGFTRRKTTFKISGEEAIFSNQHFYTSTTTQSSFLQDELDALFEGDILSFWADMELKLDCDTVEKAMKIEGRLSNGPEEKPLTFDLVSHYFCMPIKQAAQELNVGLTLLKKRCRELGIPLWPHRRVKSLQTLIKNVQELGKETGGDEDTTRSVVELLQQTKKLIEQRPDVMLDKKTKILKQVCFEENFKRRRLMAVEG